MSAKQNKRFNNYLSNHPSFRKGMKPDIERIGYLKYNLSKFFDLVRKDGNFLDIGPGLGEVLVIWKAMGIKNISSVDISSEVASYIRKLGFKCDFVKDTTRFLMKNQNKFDLINLCDVLEHVEQNDLFNFTTAIYLALKPKGKLIIRTSNAGSPFLSANFYCDITHTMPFSESSLSQLFSQSGFTQYQFFPAVRLIKWSDLKRVIGKYLITPIYYFYVRLIRAATLNYSPKILTEGIIAVATKD